MLLPSVGHKEGRTIVGHTFTLAIAKVAGGRFVMQPHTHNHTEAAKQRGTQGDTATGTADAKSQKLEGEKS
jgi:hypothetical protein